MTVKHLIQMSLVILVVFVSFAKGYQQNGADTKPSASALPPLQASKTSDGNQNSRLDAGSLLSKDKMLSPVQTKEEDDDFGLIEVKESDIPEGAEVYVLEEPENTSTDGEILQTAHNIVFRPLFRYREKQEAQRRNSNRIRRRYFVPRRPYRNAYPYYYPNRYYY